MPAVSRVGDKNQAGGAIMVGASSVMVDGIPVGLVGDQITPHAPWGRPHPPHDAARVTSGSSTVFIEGKAVAIIGSSNSCGHSIVEGSGSVFIT